MPRNSGLRGITCWRTREDSRSHRVTRRSEEISRGVRTKSASSAVPMAIALSRPNWATGSKPDCAKTRKPAHSAIEVETTGRASS